MKATTQVIALVLSLFVIILKTTAQTNTFPSSGNVGIGDFTPNSLLHVYGGNVKVEDGDIELTNNDNAYKMNGTPLLWTKGNTLCPRGVSEAGL